MKIKQKKRTDEDYVALDNAIGVLMDWGEEIKDDLEKRGLSWKPYAEILQSMANVHSPE